MVGLLLSGHGGLPLLCPDPCQMCCWGGGHFASKPCVASWPSAGRELGLSFAVLVSEGLPFLLQAVLFRTLVSLL